LECAAASAPEAGGEADDGEHAAAGADRSAAAISEEGSAVGIGIEGEEGGLVPGPVTAAAALPAAAVPPVPPLERLEERGTVGRLPLLEAERSCGLPPPPSAASSEPEAAGCSAAAAV
jgi:hypothetical protein